MRVLFASSEVAPFAKTGGLADVAGALPKPSRVLATTFASCCQSTARWTLQSTDCGGFCPSWSSPLPEPVEAGAIWECRNGHVPTYFIEQDDYYDREGLYQMGGRDHPDNAERFAFFSRAVLELMRASTFRRACTTATTGRRAWYQRTFAAHTASTPSSRTPVYCSPSTTWAITASSNRQPWRSQTWGRTCSLPVGVEFYGKVNFLKAGLVFSDRSTR